MLLFLKNEVFPFQASKVHSSAVSKKNKNAQTSILKTSSEKQVGVKVQSSLNDVIFANPRIIFFFNFSLLI